MISVMKARKLFGRGCEGFMCNMIKIEVVKSSLADIPVVKEFPEEIPGMPPLKEV